MVCCALIALMVAGVLYLARALIPGLSNDAGTGALSWRAPMLSEGSDND